MDDTESRTSLRGGTDELQRLGEHNCWKVGVSMADFVADSAADSLADGSFGGLSAATFSASDFSAESLYRANGRGGFGSKIAADPFCDPRRTHEKQTVGSVTASQTVLTLQALSSSLNTGAAKRGCLGRGEGFGPSGSLSPRTAASIYTF